MMVLMIDGRCSSSKLLKFGIFGYEKAKVMGMSSTKAQGRKKEGRKEEANIILPRTTRSRRRQIDPASNLRW